MSINTEGRKKKSFLNIITASGASLAGLLISFLNRYVFLRVLDATYLGVSGLFSNITVIFSLVELGMGAALTQMFYRPFAEKDYEQLSRVTHTTKLLLNVVGIIIIILTVLFTPLLSLFVNDIHAVPNMRIIFLLYGTNSGITYFWGYHRTIITADQQAYKLVKIDISWKVVTFIVQSLTLVFTKNFIIYLLAQIILNFLLNVIVKCYVRNQYIEIDFHSKELISKNERSSLMKNVAALSMNKIASIVTNGTDNIIISKCLNLVTVGLASNYLMIQQVVIGLLESIFTPLLASIGNLCVDEDSETKYKYYNRFSFVAFWLYSFGCVTAFTLSDSFVSFVFGKDYTIPKLASFFLFFDLFCVGLYRVATLYRTAEGLFWYGKFRPLIQSIINLIVSLLLVNLTHELWAVYAGTAASRILITIWYEPLIVLKYSMGKKPWRHYLRQGFYGVAFFIAVVVMQYITNSLPLEGIFLFIIGGILCTIVINGLYILFFWWTEEFQFWIEFIKKCIRKSC